MEEVIVRSQSRWSEEELQRLELGVVGAFARGCHDAGIAQFCLLSAAGSTARSRFRYVRAMGMKEDTVRSIGITRLAIFRPGIIVGNHLSRLPGRWPVTRSAGEVLPTLRPDQLNECQTPVGNN
jgi:hypothetical protein